jgi:hypothetical protein
MPEMLSTRDHQSVRHRTDGKTFVEISDRQ